MKIQEAGGGEAESTLLDHTGKVREPLHSDHITPPPGQHSITGRDTEPTFLQWKREPKVDMKFPQYFRTLVGRPKQVSFPGNHQGNFGSSTTGNQIEMEKRGRAYSKQPPDFGRHVLACSSGTPRKDPSQQICPFADLNQSPCLDRELSWQFCLM